MAYLASLLTQRQREREVGGEGPGKQALCIFGDNTYLLIHATLSTVGVFYALWDQTDNLHPPTYKQ